MPYYNAADMRARARDAWHSEWISKQGLKERFWTEKAISEFLGKPQKSGPIMAWKRKNVQRVESTLEFQNWLAKRREWLANNGKLLSSDVR
jgi:cytochrome c2